MRADLPRRGLSRWLGPLVLVVLLIALQGLLTRLADAAGLPAPDLFLLTGAGLAWRMRPAWALVAAYGVGLGQDVLGGGMIGLHAAGIAGGALLVLLVRRYFANSGPVQGLLTVVMAVVGQWLAFLLITYWLRSELVTVELLIRTVPPALLLTLLVSGPWERVLEWGIGPRPSENLS
ncbi:Rod shape-determining protein MreD [Deinococcus koreensis]|uniref:Rod shape-determining protein MreD n=1 Tax=Deinococcus koreensis TaxID=2054903 RepID=A0A2K3V191_9DEIO|nr:Rod shape-determining protein MreD [Deinococcus koreensis]PNY82555.1 Rod shape-determining protein MreD [Deinococcus koreensis]